MSLFFSFVHLNIFAPTRCQLTDKKHVLWPQPSATSFILPTIIQQDLCSFSCNPHKVFLLCAYLYTYMYVYVGFYSLFMFLIFPFVTVPNVSMLSLYNLFLLTYCLNSSNVLSLPVLDCNNLVSTSNDGSLTVIIQQVVLSDLTQSSIDFCTCLGKSQDDHPLAGDDPSWLFLALLSSSQLLLAITLSRLEKKITSAAILCLVFHIQYSMLGIKYPISRTYHLSRPHILSSFPRLIYRLFDFRLEISTVCCRHNHLLIRLFLFCLMSNPLCHLLSLFLSFVSSIHLVYQYRASWLYG